MSVRCDNVNNYQPDIVGKIIKKIKQRRECQKDQASQKHQKRTVRKEGFLIYLARSCVSEYTLADTKAGYRNYQIAQIGYKIRRTVLHTRKIGGIERKHKYDNKL